MRRPGVLQRDQQLVSQAVAPQPDAGADGQPALPAGAAAQLRDGLLGQLLFLLAPLGALFVGHRDALVGHLWFLLEDLDGLRRLRGLCRESRAPQGCDPSSGQAPRSGGSR